MELDARLVSESKQRLAMLPDADEVGWFAARQPGVVRFLEDRLDADALALGLAGAWQISILFQEDTGVTPGRISSSLIARAELAVVTEAGSRVPVVGGLADRQPALLAWVEELTADPPLVLGPDERREVGLALAAVIYALDQMTMGRSIPGD